MDNSNGRRKWSSAEPNIQVPLNVPAAKEEVPPQYEHYLHLLQERNRLIRRLQKKDKKEIELEKKEKGFTLYLNSSFSSDQTIQAKKHRHHKYRSRTADNLQGSNFPGVQFGNQSTSRSANQGKGKRKNWCIGSVEFTTADGQRQKIKPPERLTGKYADDFESSTDSDCDPSELIYSMSSLNVDDDQSTSVTNTRRHKTNYLKKVVAAKREEAEAENRVTIKLEDVKKLRESLQMNTNLRQSLAMEVDSEFEEEITEEIVQDDSDEGRVSPVVEEIEEDISSEDENREREEHTIKPLDVLKPGNTLVLEFQSLPRNNASKASRPLSANLRNSNSRADPKEEASAVIKALQEENKKVELFSRSSSSRPLPQPKSIPGAPRALPSPSKESTKLLTPMKSSSNPDQARSDNPTVDSKLPSAGDDNSNISAVIERVLKMNPRQQKQLLQTLNHIDVDEKSIDLSKDSSQLNSVANSWALRSPVTDHFEVTLEILSNWGHPTLVGLTELEFFDQSGCLIPVKSSDVSVHGARSSTNKVDVLFNGKSKTTRERNMWSCLFDGRPVEFSILIVNPHPGKQFQLGSVKVWNWNNKISNLDIGAREIKIVFGGELLFCGEVDKGCGNQVFDYSKHITFSHLGKTNISPAKKPVTRSGLLLNLSNAAESSSVCPSPCGPGRPLPNLMSPTEAQKSPATEENQKVTSSRSHHSFRSISRSSQSSASSSGSAKVKGQTDGRVEEGQADGQFRSETRTLNYPTIFAAQSSNRSAPTSPEVSVTDSDLSKIPEKKRAQTPKKTNSIAARLSGKSVESESSSKSNTDSYESKPPLPPTDKSNEKISSSSRSVDRSSNMTKSKLSPKSSRSEPHMSPQPNSTSANTSMANSSLIKSQDAKTKDVQDQSLVDKIKTMGQSENKRKKDIPQWLKGDKTTDLAENESGRKSTSGLLRKTGGKIEDEAIQKQLDEELERFSQSGGGNKDNPSKSMQEENDVLVPLKRTDKSRAKWRSRDENLEESWGSLSFFNKSHRGRVSVDIADDELEEYLSVSRKPVPEVLDSAPKVSSLSNDDWLDDDSEFTIPELPYGRELVINIKTTWGDHHYVGLTGLELFSNLGEKVPIAKIWANPSDINILPEYNKDPRVVTNIIDQVNRTRDDVHMWLAPFNPGKDHLIYITFVKPCKLALMRIWNYNKSRIHSYRGAKDVVITLDGTEIFKGEIARACGGIEGGTEAFGDTILFTTDENILEAVSQNDDAFECNMPGDDEEDVPFERPSTANAEDETRPFTRAAGLLELEKKKNSSQAANLNFVTSVGDVMVYKTNKLQLIFTATWGDLHYLGLTGLEIVGSEGETIPLTQSMVTACPKDLRHLAGHDKDDRTLDKLLDGVNITCLDSHMWLIPFTKGGSHTVTVTFPQQTLVTAVRIWNYNKSPEDTYRGAKVMHVQINDRVISPAEGYLLRKGPGVCHFDFAQEISFSNTSPTLGHGALSDGSVGRDQHLESSVQMPRGFIFQLQLFCTWGDQYYIGLNGLEFYDALFNKIELTETNIAAYPDSVNVLDNVSNDARTPDKLIDGFNDTNDGRHMWLAPILPSVTNRVYVIFDQPTSVSMIKLWNYSKTVNRGVKDFALLVDDLLVYNGRLQAVSGGAIGIVPSCSAPIPHHTILFSDNKDILHKEKNSVISNQAEDQDIQLLNDKQIVSKYAKTSSSKPVNQALRPKTSVATARMVKR